MRILLAVSCLGLLLIGKASKAHALEVRATSAEHSPLVEQLVREELLPVIERLPEAERHRLVSVKIEVAASMDAFLMALSIDGPEPRILISDAFIEGLAAYTEIYLIARQRGDPHLIERYFHYYLWRRHPQYEGPPPLGARAWAGFDPPSPAAFSADKAHILQGALLDVLLHEMGHHAERAFYGYRSAYWLREEQEALADDWAFALRKRHFQHMDPLGRLIPLAYIFERDRWLTLARDNNRPRILPWIAENLEPLCEAAEQPPVQQLCVRLRGDIDTYFSKGAEPAYRARLEQGEGFASFPLGQLLRAKEQHAAACRHFDESLRTDGIPRAALYVGWCYQQGYLVPVPPDAPVLALSHYRAAIAYGFGDARDFLATLRASD